MRGAIRDAVGFAALGGPAILSDVAAMNGYNEQSAPTDRQGSRSSPPFTTNVPLGTVVGRLDSVTTSTLVEFHLQEEVAEFANVTR